MVFGIFISYAPELGITGKAVNDICMDVPVGDVKWLRDMIEERSYTARAAGNSIWPSFKELASEGKVSDVSYLLELRYNLNELSRYYWNLDFNENVNFVPRVYYYQQDKLFLQAFGKDFWSNANPSCIKQVDLDELSSAISQLKWILVPSLRLAVETTKKSSWDSRFGRAPRGDENVVCDSASQTCTKTYIYDYACNVVNYGYRHSDGRNGRVYESCKVNGLNLAFEVKEAKAFIGMRYDEPNFAYFEKVEPVINVNEQSYIYNSNLDGGYVSYSLKGEKFNLADISFSFDEVNEKSNINVFEIKPGEQDVIPLNIDVSIAKGYRGSLYGIFVRAYDDVSVDLKVDKNYLEKKKLDFDEYNKVNSDGDLVITEYDELNCNILAEKITTADFRIVDNHEKVLSEKKGVSCNNDKCEYVFRVGKDVKNWPRGEINYNADSTKLKCVVEVDSKKYMSSEVSVAKHIYGFIHSDKSNVNNAKEQFDYFIKLSALKHDKVKPIYYSNRYRCFISEEKVSKDIEKCFKELYRDYNYKYDRIIGLADDSVFDPKIQHVILIDDNLKSLAHEIGHSYNLADEYNYDAYSSIKNPLNPYPKCAFDNPIISEDKKLEGNNCWDDTKDFVDFCYSAGMPLPNGYETKDDLAKPYRSIMGKYDISSYEIEHKYPPEACYPLTTKDCGDIKVYSDCLLGACKEGGLTHIIPPYVKGDNVIYNKDKPDERRSIVYIGDTNKYEIYPCSAHRPIKELKSALKGIKPDGGKFKGQVNVDYTPCSDSFCPIEWTTVDYNKQPDAENAFKIEEKVSGRGEVVYSEGIRIIPPELREGRFYVIDEKAENNFPMQFAICPKRDSTDSVQLWDLDLKLEKDGPVVKFLFFKGKNYYKIKGTGRLELLMKVEPKEECGVLSERIIQDTKANWAACQGMYDDMVIGNPDSKTAPLEAVTNKAEQQQLKSLLDTTLIKKCISMEEGYNSKDGGKTYDFNIEILIEQAGDKQKLIIKDTSTEPKFETGSTIVSKKTVYEFLSASPVIEKPEIFLFDQSYLNCCKPKDWKRSK